jgi:flavin reductase (DIM6/NTAB) family NADH-FMN oxidoreductase RutF
MLLKKKVLNLKKEINVLDYASEIMNAVKSGVLLTASADGKANTMSISWGSLGIEWNRVLFTTFVRLSRYTYEFLEKNGEFTISIPREGSPKKLIAECGSNSGRDMDKAKTFGFNYVACETVNVPAVKEYPLVLECKVVYKQLQDEKAIDANDLEKFYPKTDGKRDIHMAYTAKIAKAYLLE